MSRFFEVAMNKLEGSIDLGTLALANHSKYIHFLIKVKVWALSWILSIMMQWLDDFILVNLLKSFYLGLGVYFQNQLKFSLPIPEFNLAEFCLLNCTPIVLCNSSTSSLTKLRIKWENFYHLGE